MDNTQRREQILQMLHESTAAVTGTALAKACSVSRQIIVGDVAFCGPKGSASFQRLGAISWLHR